MTMSDEFLASFAALWNDGVSKRDIRAKKGMTERAYATAVREIKARGMSKANARDSIRKKRHDFVAHSAEVIKEDAYLAALRKSRDAFQSLNISTGPARCFAPERHFGNRQANS